MTMAILQQVTPTPMLNEAKLYNWCPCLRGMIVSIYRIRAGLTEELSSDL
jgi:hypothetical protein